MKIKFLFNYSQVQDLLYIKDCTYAKLLKFMVMVNWEYLCYVCTPISSRLQNLDSVTHIQYPVLILVLHLHLEITVQTNVYGYRFVPSFIWLDNKCWIKKILLKVVKLVCLKSDVASQAILFFGVLAGVKFSPNPLILCNLLSETETKLLIYWKRYYDREMHVDGNPTLICIYNIFIVH